MTADDEVGDVYRLYAALSCKAKAQFNSLAQATDKAVVANNDPPKRLEAMLYSRIQAKVYEYHGIRLPPLAVLSKRTSAKDELRVALDWLRGGKALDRETATGLVELAAEAVAREVPWGPDNTAYLHKLRGITASVDRAYPGYCVNGILQHIARQVGEGALPLNDVD